MYGGRGICVRLTAGRGYTWCAVSSIVGVGGVRSFKSSVALCDASDFDMVFQPFQVHERHLTIPKCSYTDTNEPGAGRNHVFSRGGMKSERWIG